MKTILITGAAGDVGTHLRRELAGKYVLRVSDLRSLKKINKEEKFVRADISKMADALRITKGVDAIVHLGGYSVEGPWEGILNANIIGCYNVFEAARRNGVKRILFPTSNHAVGFYRRDQTIDHRVYIKPDSRYGVSKVFGEALGSLYADKYGMEVFCMRIGNVNAKPIDKRRLSILFTPRDLAQLVTHRHRASGHPLRDRVRHLAQQARLVRQFERLPPRLQAAGRFRGLRRGDPRARAGGRRSGRRGAPGRGLLRRGGGPESRALAAARREAEQAEVSQPYSFQPNPAHSLQVWDPTLPVASQPSHRSQR